MFLPHKPGTEFSKEKLSFQKKDPTSIYFKSNFNQQASPQRIFLIASYNPYLIPGDSQDINLVTAHLIL